MTQESVSEEYAIIVDKPLHSTHERLILSHAYHSEVHDCLNCEKCFVGGSAKRLLQYDTVECRSQQQVLQVMDAPPILQGQEMSKIY